MKSFVQQSRVGKVSCVPARQQANNSGGRKGHAEATRSFYWDKRGINSAESKKAGTEWKRSRREEGAANAHPEQKSKILKDTERRGTIKEEWGEKPLEQSLSHNWKQRLEFGRGSEAIRSENRKVKDVGTEQAPWITELGANP